MHYLFLKSVTPNLSYGQSKKSLKIAQFRQCTQGYSLWFDKSDPSQNMDQSTSLERPYRELLNALFIFGILLLLTKVVDSQKEASNSSMSKYNYTHSYVLF